MENGNDRDRGIAFHKEDCVGKSPGRYLFSTDSGTFAMLSQISSTRRIRSAALNSNTSEMDTSFDMVCILPKFSVQQLYSQLRGNFERRKVRR
jgi:hypothetical protein